MTTAEGLSDRITFEHGDAENLPIPADSVDVALSFTVMEEVDADRMLAEMVRVTRPGWPGRDRGPGPDMRPWINLAVRPELLAAAAAVPGAGAADLGCSDASLYRRFDSAGLKTVMLGPQLATDRPEVSPERLRQFAGRIAQGLGADDAHEFRAAVKQAVEQGSMLWAEPYHGALAIKP